MVPTFTCGFFRSNTAFAMVGLRKFCLPQSKLALGIEPRTSTLPRWRSAAELCQRSSTTTTDAGIDAPGCSNNCAKIETGRQPYVCDRLIAYSYRGIDSA